MNKIIDVDIEITSGSNIKYEFDSKTGKLVVDRILRDGFVYPANYGQIPNTIDWDGDGLDVLVFSQEKFLPGIQLRGRVVGAMQMIDSGETDTKLIAVHHDDYRLDNIESLADLPKEWLDSIDYFFSNYKNWKKPGITKVLGFQNQEWALKELEECKELFEKYSNLDKDDFIAKMKLKHPEKYV